MVIKELQRRTMKRQPLFNSPLSKGGKHKGVRMVVRTNRVRTGLS
jgi:hypothetical protein